MTQTHVLAEPRHARFTGQLDFHQVTTSERDLCVLSEISRATFYDTFISITRPDDMEAFLDSAYSTDTLKQQIQTPGSVFYFLLADGKLAGYLKLNQWVESTQGAALSDPMMRQEGAFEIERVYIVPAFKHRGIGRHVMNFAEQQAVKSGATHMWLGVWEGNTPAKNLYLSQGFVVRGSHTFQVGHDPQTDLLLSKQLSK